MKSYFKRHKDLLIKWLCSELGYALSLVMWSFFMKSLSEVLDKKGLCSITNLIIFGVVFLFFSFFSIYLLEVYKAKFLNKCNVSLKEDIYEAIAKKNINDFNDNNSAKYISILNNDVRIIEENYFTKLPGILSSCILILVAGITMFYYNPLLAIVTILINLIPFALPYIACDIISIKKKEHVNSLEHFNVKIKDIFNGFEVIKVSSADDKVKEKYEKINKDTEDKLLEFRKTEALINSIVSVLNYTMSVVRLSFSVYLVSRNYITLGVLMGIMQISNYVTNPAREVTRMITNYKSIKEVKFKIEELLNGTMDIEKEKIDIEKINTISLNNINFQFDTRKKILNDVNFKFETGKKYAVVGGSGSGKSTMIKLIMRYYDEFQGEIFFDDVEGRDINKKSLYENISLINQEIILFDDTVKNNITMFKEYSDEEVIAAAELAGISNLISGSKGIYSRVHENGNNFSGGEKQRIAIARAFIRKTPILILDEATSSLDNKTAHNIEELLLRQKDLTIIVVTHKLKESLLKNYDDILVMKNGEIIEHNSFNELMNKKEYFYNLYNFGM